VKRTLTSTSDVFCTTGTWGKLKGVVDADAVSMIEGVSVESEAIVYTVALMVLSFQAEGMGSLRAF